ncbi:MAG: isopeptide-forming domain-containing fimbrial protein, partial [Anaerolineales bacterium]|nr:isopeptide-forming domain-containing fimbrial protein [Anaerolineales bacterium]
MNNLTIADTLSSNLQFTSVVSTSPAAVCTPPPAGIPGGTLSCDFGAGPVSGSPNVVFEYFIPQFDAGGGSVLPPPSGDDRTSPDNVRASASWDPDDGRDPVTPLTINAAGPEHTLNDRSIAIQKSASPGSGTPGTVVTYTLSFQISDYFTFGDLVATDTISDGQRLLMGPGFEPSLSVTDRVETRGGLFAYTPPAYPPNPPNPPAPGDDLLIDVSRIGNSGPGVPPDGTDGSTLLTFEVSDALIRLGAADGILQGGRAIVPNAGPATGTITYYARIQDVFSDTYPSTDPSVDQGDRLSNSVSITGTIRNNALITQVDGVEDDGSGAGVTIARGPVTKSLYAINGGSPTPPRVAPGDTVTYRITYEMPASDVEDLYFIDYLPLPVFDVADPNAEAPGVPVWTYLAAAAPGTLPAPGEVTRGLTDTFSGPTGISGISPLLTPTGSSNSLRIFYGSFDDSSNRASKIDLLFTITVTQDPFADGLFLTNQLRQHEGSTNAGPDDTDVIIQIQVQEPVLFLTKGVGATDNPAGAFAPPQVGPLSVTFNPPGSNPSWTGLVSSGGLSGPPPRPIDSNLGGVDAGDLATFALVIENQGTSPYGAFDIRLRDLLAPGYVIPSTGLGLNLQIRRGSGTPIGYQALNTSGVAVGAPNTQPEYLFYDVGPNHGGLELLDPSDAEGVCQGHNLGSGANIVILTYDLQLAPGVAPNTVNTNTASVTQYASRNGGPNFLDPGGPLTDQATVTTALPVVTKTITGTNQAHTLLTNVAIGERVTYQLVITIPEGVSNNATVVDTLDSGLAFVSLDSLTASADLSTSIGGEFPQVLTTARAGLAAPGGAATYSFGTLTNSNRVNAAPETITITYTAVVLNSPGNDRGVGRNNSAVISWTGGSASGAAPNVVIVEPTLQAAKAAVPNSGDAGDTIAFTLTFSHTAASNADAFNVTLNDPLPAGMTYVGTSLNCTSGVQDPDSSFFATGVITA